MTQSEDAPSPSLNVSEFFHILTARVRTLLAEVDPRFSSPSCESVTLDQEVLLKLSDASRRELFQIYSVLGKICRGVFGRCEVCEEQLPVALLRLRPLSRFCLRCEIVRSRLPLVS